MSVGAFGFVLCAVAIAVLAGAGHVDPERFAPFGELLDDVLLERATRVVVVLFWWWLGWHMLVA